MNRTRSFRALALTAAVLLLSHCTAPVSVRMGKPGPPAGAPAVRRDTESIIAAIRDAHDRIRRGDDSAIPTYNYAVARLIESLEQTGADPWNSTLALSGAGGVKQLKGRSPAGTAPLHDKLFPTDTLAFHGKYSEHRAQVSGIGAPLVLVTSFEGLGHEKARKNLPLRNLTAVVSFVGNTATLELIDPYQIETVTLAGKPRPLAADYGAAVMLGMSKARVDKLGLVRLLRPTRYNDTANLNFMQPYDPKRIPVLMVHGLDSTPATFAPMYFKLLQDPEIRKNYQFWVFSYPSGYPYPYSASLLRRELEDVRRDYPGHRNMVIVGHSMGSMISRLMVTDAGDKLWLTAFGHKPSETRISGHSRNLVMEALVFEDRKEIDRAIFYSGPHRGSMIANNWIGSTAARLVKMPGLIADVRNSVISIASADTAGLMMQRAPNSIGTLSPDNPFVLAVNKLPIAPRIPYHTIVGDRGKGDTPNSSDGVVAYWSSHLDGAVSEKIVPSGHGSHENPEGIEEARRILHDHLKSL
ncbi:MAG: alpha/beta fold hydrolase [Luteolibacter sp.]|jgi:pimeloyl-ACP methyl ester carboxylesterase|nr:alpha/beta fold hydrolase [Luteolibacter sp.]